MSWTVGSVRLGAGYVAGLVLLTLTGCECSAGDAAPAPAVHEVPAEESLPGGKASITARRGLGPVATLPNERRPDFHAGQALAKQPWVPPPTTTDARDGLGPLYNAHSCFACHPGGGRGRLPRDAAEPVAGGGLLRLSVPGQSETIGGIPEPTYGDQLQTKSVALSSLLGRETGRKGEVEPEATLTLRWSERVFRYPDGTEVKLTRPEPQLGELAYGPLASDTLTSLRVAPPLFGLGLLEAIPQPAIDALADPDDRDGDGISGRVNQVWDRDGQRRAPGRFGHKANQPNLRQQVAAAFASDIGITNPLFGDQPCGASQVECLASPSGAGKDGFELSEDLLTLVAGFVRDVGVPARADASDPEVVRGRAEFARMGCRGCHQPSFVTQSSSHPHLGGHTIWPYSDLLLHDLGEALADGRPDYDASGSEWRTAPLWAQDKPGKPRYLLHDGRASTYEEAILWHGGEAQTAQESFVASSSEQRAALVRFLESL